MVKDGPFDGLWNQLKILRHEKMMPSTLISGANRGIGLEFARQYLADKWQVYASCRDPSSASELRRMADGSGGKLQVLSMDVGDLASVRRQPSNFRASQLTLSSTMPASAALAVRPSAILITKHGDTCSTSTPWALCESQRHSSTM